jgi:hypothetical protein
MRYDFLDSPLSISLIVLMTSWNIGLAMSIGVLDFPLSLLNLDNMGLYFFGAVQIVVVLAIYQFLRRGQTLAEV